MCFFQTMNKQKSLTDFFTKVKKPSDDNKQKSNSDKSKEKKDDEDVVDITSSASTPKKTQSQSNDVSMKGN